MDFAQEPQSIHSGNISLGGTHEVLNVNGGFSAINFPRNGINSSGPEGFFAQPSNEGRTSQNNFADVTELNLKVGYSFAPWMRATVGYSFLYWNNVIRPVDQIDRNLPIGQTFLQSGAVSASSPAREFSTTDFYANGLSFGLTFRY